MFATVKFKERGAMPKAVYVFLSLLFLVHFAGQGQERVAPENLGERVIAIVPLIGDGTARDPKRSMFVPAPPDPARARMEAPVDPAGAISYSMIVSDDNKFAIVEFVAQDIKALEPILKAQRPDVKVFRKGQHTKAEIDAEARRVKRDFDSAQLLGSRP
jgi:hypothetical protein